MRKLVLGMLAALTVIACDDNPTNPSVQATYFAPLRSSSEVPPNNSVAVGQANFRLNAAGTELTYDLVSKDISNIVQSHIHIAPEGVNGPIVQFLFGLVAAGSGPQVDDVVAKGKIDGSSFTGTLTGRPFSELIAAIEAGNAYVNVHTNDGVAPTTNQPGDIPGGEIRGQIRRIQ
jgi:CHRD domain-containing protein